MDKELTNELLISDEIPQNTHQLFYTIKYIEGQDITVHVYNQDEEFLETINIKYPFYTIINYMSAYGYDEIELFTDSEFNNPYVILNDASMTLYAKASLDYATITLYDNISDKSFYVKHPVNETVNRFALRAYLTNIDPGYQNVLFYYDQEFTNPVNLEKINSDITFYIRSNNHLLYEQITFEVVGDYETTKTIYLYTNLIINQSDIREYIESEFDLATNLNNITMYSDPELTNQVDNFMVEEYDTIYIKIDAPELYELTIIDSLTSDVLWVLTYEEGDIVDEIADLVNMINPYVPFEFRSQVKYEYYYDQALTDPVGDIVMTEDINIYVDVVEAISYDITYQFIGVSLDDLVLSISEKENIAHRQDVFAYVARHYGKNTSIKLSFKDTNTGRVLDVWYPSADMIIEVQVTLIQVYEVEFIYELDGGIIHDVMVFKEGSIIDDTLFFGVLFDNPNDYDAYFYADESMTDGTLTVTIDQDMTLYVKVVNKYR